MARKSINYCVADAFTESPFKGNPAAVCLLPADDGRGDDVEWMQAVAREFNQPITCFLMRLSDGVGSGTRTVPRFRIRWFTTVLEFVLPSGEEVAKVEPNFDEIRKFPGRGIIITGIAPPISQFDFVSRFFSPIEGIDEDQVCGSAHCALATYWMKRLGKHDFVAYQASKRGGVLNLHVDDKNKRVLIQGKATTVMEGSLLV